MNYFKILFAIFLGLYTILPSSKAEEDVIDVNEDSEFQDVGLNWNKARIYHFFAFLNTNPCNMLYTALGIGEAQCTLRCLNVGSQFGGMCSNGQCRCNVLSTNTGRSLD